MVNSANKVIISERVFEENPLYLREKLTKELKRLFETDDLFFIPAHKKDWTGHADGMVRFIDNNTILINDYENEYAYFKKEFYKAIEKTGLNYKEIPYNPYGNKDIDAKAFT